MLRVMIDCLKWCMRGESLKNKYGCFAIRVQQQKQASKKRKRREKEQEKEKEKEKAPTIRPTHQHREKTTIKSPHGEGVTG